MHFKKLNLLAFLSFFFLALHPAHADSTISDEAFLKGNVLSVSDVETEEVSGIKTGKQEVEISIEKEGGKDVVISIDHSVDVESKNPYILHVGDDVVLSKIEGMEPPTYTVYEPYRLNGMLWVFLIFLALCLLTARKKGVTALLALGFSFFIIMKGLIPSMIAGASPVITSFVASILIAIVTFYLTHGFKKRTSLALASTLLTLILAFVLSKLAIDWTQLFGMGSEDAASLNFSGLDLDLRGLLLGAIVIGTLGILDDVTVTQIATVYQIHKANTRLNFKELYKRGLSVGRDHITSIINTLVLAYAGASFPALIFLVHSPWPLWITLNNEFLAEEIVRTLVGSMTLMIAVPISTLFGAYYYSKKATK